MRFLVRGLCAIAVLAVGVVVLRADEDVYLKGKVKPLNGTIKSESSKGIVLAPKGGPIAADDIDDIQYKELKPIQVRIAEYRPGWAAEKDANSPAKEAQRKANLADALGKYQNTLAKLDPNQPYVSQHLEYKIAYLTAVIAQESSTPTDEAIAKLKDYKSKHADSWQISGCLKLLARLQLDKKQYADAEQTYKDLAQANVSDESRQEAELSAAQVSVRAGNHAAAQQKLQALVAKLPKDSPFIARAQIAQAECLVAAKKPEEARKLLKQIVKDTTDKGLKAIAYNTLGESYLKASMLKEARWEFLWVDVVYNQDRNEHAKALYYLWWIFEQLNEPERAEECRQTLVDDPAFNGTEYQRVARRDKKAPAPAP